MASKDPIKAQQQKYSDDGPFHDPVLRCDGCSKIVKLADLKKIGCCPNCGNTRVKKLRTFSKEEWQEMQKWGIDPEFLALFKDSDSGTRGDTF